MLKQLAFVTLVLELVGCASHSGISHLCVPDGAKIERPGNGSPVLHAVEVPPDRIADGLSVSTLEKEGIDPESIDRMLDSIRDGEYTKIDSILITRHGKLVLEAYFNGYSRDTKHDTRSAFKSVTSALTGIAVDRDLISDIDRPISEYFSDYWPGIQGDIELKSQITLTHLLTMTPGFDAEESFGIGPFREDDMFRAKDWVTFTLDLPMASKPGERFSYNSSSTFLIGEIVARSAGRSLPAFAQENLFEPLGITDYCWSLTPKGRAVAQGSFYIRPRDMIKIGQLFLNQGVWHGQGVISAHWVEESTRHHVDRQNNQSESQPRRNGYGFQWWTRRARNPRFDHYFASGNGGQKIFVFPRIEMVVVFTGSHYNQAIGHRQPAQILNQYIAPAIYIQ